MAQRGSSGERWPRGSGRGGNRRGGRRQMEEKLVRGSKSRPKLVRGSKSRPKPKPKPAKSSNGRPPKPSKPSKWRPPKPSETLKPHKPPRASNLRSKPKPAKASKKDVDIAGFGFEGPPAADLGSRGFRVSKKIHTLVMPPNYTGCGIKSSHSLQSWNGGVLVMASGSLQKKSFTGRRKFVQIFFLVPQETGYFVLKDVFHFIDDDPVHQYPAVILAQNNLDAKLAPTAMAEPVPYYFPGGEIQTRDFMAPAVKENGPESYGYVDHWLEQVVETENLLDDRAVEQSNGLVQNVENTVQDHLPASVEEPIGEPQKQTYASMLRVAKGQPAPSAAPQNSTNKGAPLALEWNIYPQSAQQPILSSNTSERPVVETADESAALEDDEVIKSVYVRNSPSTVSPSEVEEEFVNFGKLKQPGGVVNRSHKDVGVCDAVVEFEDISGARVANYRKKGTTNIIKFVNSTSLVVGFDSRATLEDDDNYLGTDFKISKVGRNLYCTMVGDDRWCKTVCEVLKSCNPRNATEAMLVARSFMSRHREAVEDTDGYELLIIGKGVAPKLLVYWLDQEPGQEPYMRRYVRGEGAFGSGADLAKEAFRLHRIPTRRQLELRRRYARTVLYVKKFPRCRPWSLWSVRRSEYWVHRGLLWSSIWRRGTGGDLHLCHITLDGSINLNWYNFVQSYIAPWSYRIRNFLKPMSLFLITEKICDYSAIQKFLEERGGRLDGKGDWELLKLKGGSRLRLVVFDEIADMKKLWNSLLEYSTSREKLFKEVGTELKCFEVGGSRVIVSRTRRSFLENLRLPNDAKLKRRRNSFILENLG